MWGNWMSLFADDMTKPIISGWYEEGQRICGMKDDKDYKIFKIDQVFMVVSHLEERYLKRIV